MKKRNLLISLTSIAMLLASCQGNGATGLSESGGQTNHSSGGGEEVDVLTDEMLKDLKEGYSFTGVKVSNNPTNPIRTPFKVSNSDGVYNYVSGRWTADNITDFSVKSEQYNIYSDAAKGDSQLKGDTVGSTYAANHYLTMGNQIEYEPMYITTATYDPTPGAGVQIETRVLSFEESYENLFKSINAADFEKEGDYTYTLKEEVLDDALGLKIGVQFNGRADKNSKASKFSLITDGSKVTDVNITLGGREDSIGGTSTVDGAFDRSGSGLAQKLNRIEGSTSAPFDEFITKLKENNWKAHTTIYGGKDSSGKDLMIGNALNVAQGGLFLEEEYGKEDLTLQGKPTSQALYYDKTIENSSDGTTSGVQKAVYVAHKEQFYDSSSPQAGKFIKYYYPSFNLSSVFFTQDPSDQTVYHLNTDLLKEYNVGIDGSFFTSYNYELPVDTLDVKVEESQITFTFTSPTFVNTTYVIRYYDVGTTTSLPSLTDIQTSSDNLTWDDLFLDTPYSSTGTYENNLIPQAGGKANLDAVPTLGGVFPQADISTTKVTPRAPSSSEVTLYEITYGFSSQAEFENAIGVNNNGTLTDGTWDKRFLAKGFMKGTYDESLYNLQNFYKIYKKANATDDKGNKGTLYAALEVLSGAGPTSNRSLGVAVFFDLQV